jgi:uncharacterized protein (TIGR02452 family)
MHMPKKLTASLLASLVGTESEKERELMAKSCVYDPKVWKKAFSEAASEVERSRLRMYILHTTKLASVEEEYRIAAGTEGVTPRTIELAVPSHSFDNVTMFDMSQEKEPGLHLRETRYAGTAHFIYADVIDVAVFMKQDQKADPLVLMFAHPEQLGRSQGGISQEESMLRRTNVADLVNNESNRDIKDRPWTYHLPTRGGLYVPNVSLIRSNETTGYKFLVRPNRLALLLAQAPLNPQATRVNGDASFTEDWRRRIDCVLAIGLQKGHDSLVLGAWGCGEMGNNCGQVASLFKEALTQRFRGCFKHVVFAFLHDTEAFHSFGAVFGAPSMPTTPEREQFDRKKRAERGKSEALKIVVDEKEEKSATEVAKELEKMSLKNRLLSREKSGSGSHEESSSVETLEWGDEKIAW